MLSVPGLSLPVLTARLLIGLWVMAIAVPSVSADVPGPFPLDTQVCAGDVLRQDRFGTLDRDGLADLRACAFLSTRACEAAGDGFVLCASREAEFWDGLVARAALDLLTAAMSGDEDFPETGPAAPSVLELQQAADAYRNAQCAVTALLIRGGSGEAPEALHCYIRAQVDYLIVLQSLRKSM